MNQYNLRDSVQRSTQILIVMGLFIMTSWAAMNHYYGSYFGGIAWIEASKEAIRNIHEESLKHNDQFLKLISKIDTPASMEQHIYCRYHASEDTPIKLIASTDLNPCQALLLSTFSQRVLPKLSEATKRDGIDHSSHTSYEMIEGKLYQQTILKIENIIHSFLTPINERWLSDLKSITATELILSTAQGEILAHTFECEGECHPNLEDMDHSDQANHHTIKMKHPYRGAYGQFHRGQSVFDAFVVSLTLSDSEQQAISNIVIVVPEDVMLFWPKIGIMGTLVLCLILAYILIKKVGRITRDQLLPIAEAIKEVDQLRSDLKDKNKDFQVLDHSTDDQLMLENEELSEVAQLKLAIELFKRQFEVTHKLSEQLRQSQKLEVIGTLAGGVAHDFNNLLSVILMSSDLLKAEFKDLIEDAQTDSASTLVPCDDIEMWSEQINEMLIACDQGKILTKQLLSLSRDRRIEKESVSVTHCCRDLMKLFRRVISEDVILEIDLPSEEEYWVWGNENALQQALMNIFINARDALDGSGRISLKVSTLTITTEELLPAGKLTAGVFVRFSITDTGKGILETDRPKLFEPFFSSKGNKGTGLGLTTVYHTIVQDMDGGIDVTSKIGQGTTFDLYLPLSERKETATLNRLEVTPTPLKSYMLVIVEDNLQVQTTLKMGLERFGFQVISFSSAEEFLQWRERHSEPIDLVISDVVMPLMSGPELWSIMQQTEPSLPFIFLTGYAGEAVSNYHVPEERVFTKPISTQELASHIIRFIES